MIEVFERLGIPVSLTGDSIETATQFKQRVTFHGQPITWTEYQAEAANVLAEKRVVSLRAEAAKRIQAVLGARDERDAELKQLNALRKVAEINYRKDANPQSITDADRAYLAAANAASLLIDAIRDRSNTFPADGAIDDDALWPSAT